jgi:hypothetical protein
MAKITLRVILMTRRWQMVVSTAKIVAVKHPQQLVTVIGIDEKNLGKCRTQACHENEEPTAGKGKFLQRDTLPRVQNGIIQSDDGLITHRSSVSRLAQQSELQKTEGRT